MKAKSLFNRLFRSDEAVLVCEDFDPRSDQFLGTFSIDGPAAPAGIHKQDLSALVDWARTRSREVVVQVGDDRFSAGAVRIKDLPEWEGQGIDARPRFPHEVAGIESATYWVRFTFGYDQSRAADISQGLASDERILGMRNVDPSRMSFECRLQQPASGAIEELAVRIVADLALGMAGAVTESGELVAASERGLTLGGGAAVTVVEPAE